MADERKQKTAESRLNDVFAGDDELGRDEGQEEGEENKAGEPLRDVNDRAANEQRARGGDLEARTRRGREEMFNDARGDRSDPAWGAGGVQGEDRSDSVTAIPADDRAMHDDQEGK